MNIDHPRQLEEKILVALRDGPIRSTLLLENIRKGAQVPTKQAFYVALRRLKKEEVVVVHNMLVSLSTVWLSKMSEFFAKAQHVYMDEKVGKTDFLTLADGEKIKYYFKSPVSSDAFWSHAFYLLVETSKTKDPVYLYNPHDWFLLARHENEKKLLDFVVGKGKKYFMSVSGQTALDRLIDKEFDDIHSKYDRSLKNLPFKENYYLNIFDDYLIEVWIEPEVARAIDNFYNRAEVFGSEEQKELDKIIATQSKTRLVISRDKKKAGRLKKLLSKNFL